MPLIRYFSYVGSALLLLLIGLGWCLPPPASDTPEDAFRIMIDLHERYALDGRDPNTYANVLWCLGLHDRPFGPARRILGTVRPMSTAVARKKMDIPAYIARIERATRTSRR